MKDYLYWEEAERLISYAESVKNYRFAFLVYISIHTGMRISDVLSLKWINIVNKDYIDFTEERTGKSRMIMFTDDIKNYIVYIYRLLLKPQVSDHCFLSQKKCVYSIQRINSLLKVYSKNIGIIHTTVNTNTLRKTFGRELYKRTNGRALNFLSEYFSHPSIRFTEDYLKIDSMFSSPSSFCFDL